MQYIWKFRLWPVGSLRTTDGRLVDVVDAGTLNTGSGPDFFNAKVRIDGQYWAGSVEIHVTARDWYRHGHDTDPAYDHVILHVVLTDDGVVRRRTDHAIIPQVVMPGVDSFRRRLSELVSDPLSDLPCARSIAAMAPIIVHDWMTALAMERLQAKADTVHTLVESYHGDWRRAIFVILARGMGFGSNADAMEQLARSVPLHTILRHSDDRRAMEAILLGLAGFLHTDNPRDDYEKQLVRDWLFYATKFSLSPTSVPVWQTRCRPGNHPGRRVAMLAGMLTDGFAFASEILDLLTTENLHRLFSLTAGEYWQTHIAPGVTGEHLGNVLGQASRDLLCVNVIAPVLYAFGEATGSVARGELAVDILTSLKPESNSVIKPFLTAGMDCPDAFTSQALLQLRRNYCQARKCLFCRLGHSLLKRASHTTAAIS